MTSFKDFLLEVYEEAMAEGKAAVKQLGDLRKHFRKERKQILSKETFDIVNACVKVINQLDSGITVRPNTEAHKALALGVNKLVVDNLLDHSPLTAKEMAVGKEVAKRIAARRRQEGN